MRRAYVGGGPGVLVSGLVWAITGGIWTRYPLATAFAALFIGGVLIFPLSVALSRALFRAAPAAKGNPLERLGLETTFVLIAGIMVAYVLLQVAPAYAIPAFAIIMGARYFAFATVYANLVYWVLGGAIAALGAASVLHILAPPGNLALSVGAVELVFSAIILLTRRQAGAPAAV
jgi:hypothetical protein